MVALWIILALTAALGLMMALSDRLFKQSLVHGGLCPVCNDKGGPCEHCNGFGIIIDATKVPSQLPENNAKETTSTKN